MRPSSVSAARRSSWPRLDRDRARSDAADPYLGRERARENARVSMACAAFAAECAANDGQGW